ncbi:Stp1/IreP family PP2C-type Ser/Thr phosphatase [Lacticaseibacillus sharpeae]|uniref:Serine threonine protein phosphatase n=1 Tax=Lacticaseibacillus sharpeae JCM 1186 = DSM 20505 TaxID=1291052 RepID=A0A0R1ZWW2_9LACO|nr:Stp1/IreP family PP2C-type Ser/Thr phosphatase [Lacticaseibacillus sharpeae]KRM56345.1 serine threonine protein phosphatase [Lacticaseibacillus sharpeae JCM 1186 = DSM 20505]
MEFAYRTDVGQKRADNQDYVGLFKNGVGASLAIVADGMGGHQGGDVASEMAVSHIGYAFEKTAATDISIAAKWLIYELQKENDLILERGQQFSDLTGMGTTIVAVLILENRFVVANIGDSRAYLYRHNHLVQITEDHSLVNELVRSGELTPEEAENFPRKNVITRSLGVAPDVDADVNIYGMMDGDMLLLCSDGLTKTVPDDQLASVLASDQGLGAKAEELIKRANDAGAPDNITALLINENGEGVDND